MQTVTYSAADLCKLVEADLKKRGLTPSGKVQLTATVKYGGTVYDADISGQATGATVRVKG